MLQQGVGYSDVLRIHGILEAMYSLSEGLYWLETKDIAQLYEIWCFIEVKNRVAAVLGVPPGEVRHRNRGELGEMFGAEMRMGRRSRILIEKAYFTRSIDTVNIGALPLRPGNAENAAMLEEFLRSLMDRKTDAQLLGVVPQKGTVTALPEALTEEAFLRDKPVKGVQKAALRSRVYPAPVAATGSPEKIRWILLSLSGQPVRILRVKPEGYLGGEWTPKQIRHSYATFDGVALAEGAYHLWEVEPA